MVSNWACGDRQLGLLVSLERLIIACCGFVLLCMLIVVIVSFSACSLA